MGYGAPGARPRAESTRASAGEGTGRAQQCAPPARGGLLYGRAAEERLDELRHQVDASVARSNAIVKEKRALESERRRLIAASSGIVVCTLSVVGFARLARIAASGRAHLRRPFIDRDRGRRGVDEALAMILKGDQSPAAAAAPPTT